jgi:hypothetical protein
MWVSKETCERMHKKAKKRRANKILSRTSLSPYFWTGAAMLDFGDAGTANLLELCHIVAASYAFADEQNVWYSSPARHMRQKSLKLRAKRMDVQLDHVRLG